MKPNIVVLGIGRSGSTITCRMLERLGWNLPDADEYAEHIQFREINESVLEGHDLAHEGASAFIESLDQPWVLKDPRFVLTADSWTVLLDHFLLWVTRELMSIEESLKRQGWGEETGKGFGMRGHSLEETHEKCQSIFDGWTGPKLQLSFEGIGRAAALFDVSKLR
jgi:hypothetical protein